MHCRYEPDYNGGVYSYCRSDIEYPLNRWPRGKEVEDAECYEGEDGRQEVEYETFIYALPIRTRLYGGGLLIIRLSNSIDLSLARTHREPCFDHCVLETYFPCSSRILLKASSTSPALFLVTGHPSLQVV
jgi:hypothetical protein